MTDGNQRGIELEQRGDVWVLHMHNDENRFNRPSVEALHAALDQVEAVDGPAALVTTGEGKFFSNGLDLDWLMSGAEGTEGFIDEVHRFSKTQQDALLPAVENRWVTLMAATTENPSFSVISPLLSRSILLTLRSLTTADLAALVERALVDERGLAGRVELDDEAREQLLRLAGGDARKTLTTLEAAAGTTLEVRR